MAASLTKSWADSPFPLIPTPGGSQEPNTLPGAVWLAREMACAHNAMLRALNSIFQQCVHVMEPQDVKDLLLYAKFWCDWIHEHHEGEESILFPAIEKITGVEGLMAANVEQHHRFEEGLEHLKKYVSETEVEEYEGGKLREIIEEFGGKLTEHLMEEIATLLALEKYDAKALRAAWVGFDEAMRQGEKVRIPPTTKRKFTKIQQDILYPIVFGTGDFTFEGGKNWPEVPFFVRYLVHYWFERKYQGVWRFSPSTTWGEKRALLFTGED